VKQRFEQMTIISTPSVSIISSAFFRIWSIPMDAVQGVLDVSTRAIPVYRIEFNERNIWFDYDRYTKPFINEAVVWEVFGKIPTR